MTRSDSFVYNYYVVQFDSRARDESSTADVRHILIGAGSNPTEEQYAAAEESAQAMLDQWKAEGGTEDAFALLAMENTADSGSQATAACTPASPAPMPGTRISWTGPWTPPVRAATPAL